VVENVGRELTNYFLTRISLGHETTGGVDSVFFTENRGGGWGTLKGLVGGAGGGKKKKNQSARWGNSVLGWGEVWGQ